MSVVRASVCFLFGKIGNKKYPAVRLPDILMSKLYFERIASVAF